MCLPRLVERPLAHFPQRQMPFGVDLRRREVGERFVVLAMVVPVKGLRAPSVLPVAAHPARGSGGRVLERLKMALAEGVVVAHAWPAVALRDTKPRCCLTDREAAGSVG
jgi:hypothetical protein